MLLSDINHCLVEKLNLIGVRNRLLDLEDLIEATKQIPADLKSVFLIQINEVRSKLDLKTQDKAINAFDNLVIDIFRYLKIRLPKGTLRDRIDAYLYPEFRDYN